MELSEELSEGIGKLSRRQGVSEYMTLLAAFQVVLWRYSGQEDIAVGTALGGREREELEELIGLFINTVVIRGEVRGDAGFEELLGRVKGASAGRAALWRCALRAGGGGGGGGAESAATGRWCR